MIDNFATIGRRAGLAAILFAGAALAAATPAAAHDHRSMDFNGITFDYSDEDLLDQLIELDAGEIADMRDEFADARADIADAVDDIKEARRDTEGFGGAVMNAAMSLASWSVKGPVATGLRDVRKDLDRAERDLYRADVDAAERAETQGAINMIRAELAGIEAELETLTDALRG